MEQNILLQGYFKIQFLYQLEKTLNILVVPLEFIRGISEEIIENVTKLSIIFVPSFVNHCLIPDEIFNGSCLINNFISISKKVMNIHISYILNQYLLIQVNTYILVMILDLICVQNFHYLMVVWEKMSLFLELI